MASISPRTVIAIVGILWVLSGVAIAHGSLVAWPPIRDWGERLSARMGRMGYSIPGPLGTLAAVVTTGALLAGSVFWLMGTVPGIAAFVIALTGTEALVSFLEERRHRLLELQIPAAMEAMVTSLRAGVSIQDSIRETVKFSQWPTRDEFTRMSNELALGADLDKVVAMARERYESRPFNIIASALVICLRQGGNLVETFERTAKNLRIIQKLEEDIRVKSAGAKMAATISFALPIGILGMFWTVEPKAVGMLFSTFRGGIVTTVFVLMNWGLYRWVRSIVEPML